MYKVSCRLSGHCLGSPICGHSAVDAIQNNDLPDFCLPPSTLQLIRF